MKGESMSPTRYVTRITGYIIAIVCTLIISNIAGAYIDPLLTTDLAMGQMENSDAAFVAMNMFSVIKSVGSIIIAMFIGVLIGLVGRDTYKFAKSFAEEINNSDIATNEKEN
jgi:branched-subunit amino acid ABC-type transport system permease component